MCSMFGRVHTISKENTVVSSSLNYAELYKIDVGTRSVFSCSLVYCM